MLELLLIVASLVVIGVVYYLLDSPRRALRARITELRHRTLPMGGHEPRDFSLKRKNLEGSGLLTLLAKPLPSIDALGGKLERLGIALSPRRYLLRRILWVLGITFMTAMVTSGAWIFGLALGIVVGLWLPFKWMRIRINRQNRAFLKIFPDAIDLIVRGLRSGLPVSESITLVASEVPEPVGGIFTTVANTMKLGVTLEKALAETARKLDLTEFNFFTTSITIQRETGGNLSEILNNLSEVLRGRYIMSMKIKAMSSEARASAMIIGALPFVVIAAVGVLSPGYLSPLIHDPRGNMAAMVAACMMGFGLWIMNRMTKFEI